MPTAAGGLQVFVLEHLIRIGREHGVLTFEADVLCENHAMLGCLPSERTADEKASRGKRRSLAFA